MIRILCSTNECITQARQLEAARLRLAADLSQLRADMRRAIAALRGVLDGMTVQELAALADLVDELSERHEAQP